MTWANSFANCLLCFLGILGSACSESPVTTQPPPALSGLYAANWSRSAATCSPKTLPPPSGSDTMKYARISDSPTTFHLLMRSEAESAISVVPTSITGELAAVLTLRGAFATAWYGFVNRTGSLTEGPRVGGHTFFVTETATDTVSFVQLVPTPPVTNIGVNIHMSGAGTAIFRDGASAGPIYTTCIFQERFGGMKGSS
jgi:hypothetical protein